MAIEIAGSYNSYAAQGMAGSGVTSGMKKKETEKTQETAGNSKSKSTAEYANELAKLVPSAEFRIGKSYSTERTGITLTVNPKLLEKMQNDPATEKEMKELIKGVEAKNRIAESYNKMTGRTTVFSHDWIDADGKFHSFSQTIRKDKLNEKLRKEAQENAEERIEKSREKTRENAEQLAEKLEEKAEEAKESEKPEEKKVVKEDEITTLNKAEQLFEEKMAASKDGTIYLSDADMKTIIEAAQEENAGKTVVRDQPQVGSNLDLKI